MKRYTDQEFLYRQTPVNYDGIAKFTSIKGNTLGWNQLVPPLSTMSAQNGTLSVADNVATITSSSSASYLGIATWGSSVALPKGGHKYLLTCEFKSSKDVSSCRLVNGDNIAVMKYNVSANTWTKVSTIASHGTPTGQYVQFQASGSFEQGDTLQVRNWNYFDLTAMGLDSLTEDEFTSLFPLSYDYNIGTLLSFNGSGIKTAGFNQWDEEWEVGGLSILNGVPVAGSTQIRSKNFCPLIGGKTYYLTCGKTDGGSNNRFYLAICFYDDEQEFISAVYSNNLTFVAPSNASYFKLATNSSTVVYGNTYNNDICVNISSSRNGEYEPYTSSTTNLPIATYFPTGMKRAGNVYDELTESKAITRIGRVDLGSLGWYYNTSSSRFITTVQLTDAKRVSNNNEVPNMVCPLFEAVSLNVSADTSRDKTIAIGSSDGNLRVRDSSFTDATAFKQAMTDQNVKLYYELATETETDIDTEIFYPFYGDGTEQILPVNGSTPTTAPIVADIVYYTKIDTNTPYRKFWLVNGNGDRWNLTEKELKSFLDSPQGLGFQKSIDVTRYGERAYKNTETYNFPQVSGDIFFYDTVNATRYEKYNEFVRFLMVQPLTLYYQIPVSIYSGIADIYTLDCEVINLTKTESKTNRVLTSNIQINGLGFYQGDTVEINGTSATVTINNDGDFPVGFEIEISGDLKNPYFTLEQDGELYGEAKFNDDSSNFSSVYVDSKDGEQNVVLKQDGSILPNPLAYQDLSISNGSVYVTFVKLEKGVSTLTIGDDNDSVSGYTIRFTPMYRSI